jgi:hypothetical protein
MAKTQAIYYRDKRGAEPVNRFIEALPAKRAAKIDACIEEHLNGRAPDAPPPEFPASSQIEGELRELRIRFANTRYRVLYQRSGGKPDRPAACLREEHRDSARCREGSGKAADGRLQAPNECPAEEASPCGRQGCSTTPLMRP